MTTDAQRWDVAIRAAGCARDADDLRELLQALGVLGRLAYLSGTVIGERRCSRCREVKPMAAFQVNRSGRGGGRRYECRECNNRIRRERYAANTETPPRVTGIGPCSCGCGRTGRYQGHGWIQACYLRWWRAGKPIDGPPRARSRRGQEAA